MTHCSLSSPYPQGDSDWHGRGVCLQPSSRDFQECRFSDFHFGKARLNTENCHCMRKVVKILSSHKWQMFTLADMPLNDQCSKSFHSSCWLFYEQPDPAAALSGALLASWSHGSSNCCHLHRQQYDCLVHLWLYIIISLCMYPVLVWRHSYLDVEMVMHFNCV